MLLFLNLVIYSSDNLLECFYFILLDSLRVRFLLGHEKLLYLCWSGLQRVDLFFHGMQFQLQCNHLAFKFLLVLCMAAFLTPVGFMGEDIFATRQLLNALAMGLSILFVLFG